MKKIGSSAVVSACTARVTAIKMYLGAKDSLFVGQEQVKAADLAEVYQAALDTRHTAVVAKGDYKSSLAAREAADGKRLVADAALQPYVVQRFGADSTEAAAFGFAPRKVTEKAALTKAKAALLNKATRDARGTMSKKAKQQIKGTLPPEAVAALAALSPPVASSAASTGTAATPAPVATPVAAPVAAPVATPVASPAAAPAAVPTPVVAAAASGATLNGAAHS